MSVGENKLESGVSEETTSFNGIVIVGVQGREAGLYPWREAIQAREGSPGASLASEIMDYNDLFFLSKK